MVCNSEIHYRKKAYEQMMKRLSKELEKRKNFELYKMALISIFFPR